MDQESRRVEVEDKFLQEKAGMKPIEGDELMPGDIFMADNITFPSEQQSQPPAPTPPTQDNTTTVTARSNDSFKTILGVSALALALGIPGSLLGGAMLLRSNTPAPVEDTDTNTHRGIRILR